MLSYRDMTFCPFDKECGYGEGCHRALTDEVHVDAIVWWKGEGAPICQYTEKPDCFDEKGRKQ